MSTLSKPIGKVLYTAEDLAELSSRMGRAELIRGVLHEMAPASEAHGDLTHRLTVMAGHYVLEHDLGKGYVAETGFQIERNPDTVLAPDWAFVAKGRLSESAPSGYGSVVPDLVLETWSPHDRKGEVANKIERWLQAGVKIVWELDTKRRCLIVHGPGRAPRRLGLDDTLTGEEVLPGFALPIRRLFPDAP